MSTPSTAASAKRDTAARSASTESTKDTSTSRGACATKLPRGYGYGSSAIRFNASACRLTSLLATGARRRRTADLSLWRAADRLFARRRASAANNAAAAAVAATAATGAQDPRPDME